MSLVKLLPAWFHAIADYAVGILLIVVAIAADGSAGATATGVVVGGVVLLVSALTRYPLGIVKVLPFTIHSAGDYLAAALLIVAPFALDFADSESGLAAFYVAMGVAVLAVSLVTNYQYSPKRAQDGLGRARPVTACPASSLALAAGPARGPAASRARPCRAGSGGPGNRLRSPMSLTTSVEPLEGNKVRLHVAIPAEDFEHAIDAAFRKLAKEVKMPGFRPGKAPRRLLEARMGSEIARDQALRDSLPEYYAEAVVAEDVDVIAPPEIDILAGEEEGDVEFDAVVEVRPVFTVEGHDQLRIEIEKPDVSDDDVATQIDQLRDRFADLEDSDAPLTDGDFAEIDIKGFIDEESVEGLTATDYLYEVGSGIVVPKLDEELHGKRPGDILKFDDTLPERFGDRAGEEVAFQVLVKDVKKKVLPELTDEWVGEVSEFETVDALQDDVRTRLDMYARVQASMAMREKIFEAAAALVPEEVPKTLVDNEMERRLHDLAHRLEEQGLRMTIPQYLAATGQEQQEFVDGVRVGATEAVRADLALRAVIAQEEIAATDEEVDAEVERIAQQMDEKPAKVRKDLERRGVIEAVRSDIARGKALAFLMDHAEVVDADGNTVDLSQIGRASCRERG